MRHGAAHATALPGILPTVRTILSAMLLALLLAPLLAGAQGCGARTGGSLLEATSAYRAAEYGRAATLARRAAEGTSGASRDRANYLEGLALVQLGRIDDAAPLLFAASGSTDAEIAADARITLGTAEIRRGDYVSAGRAYRRASEVLEGEDARRAGAIADRCFARARERNPFAELESPSIAAGPERSAQAPAASGSSTSNAPSTPTQTPGSTPPARPAPPPGPRFAIQAGAFAAEDRADEVARSLAARVAGLGIGEPRVYVKRRPDGTMVHVVQVGSFPDRISADRVLRGFSKDGYTVERAGP